MAKLSKNSDDYLRQQQKIKTDKARVQYMLYECVTSFTEWEYDFLESLEVRLGKGIILSLSQEEHLSKLEEKEYE